MICSAPKDYVPMKAKEIAVLLQIPKGTQKGSAAGSGTPWVEEGKAEVNARGRYRKRRKEKTAGSLQGDFF